jgi:tetratricopeptide (TPR) repeat protein
VPLNETEQRPDTDAIGRTVEDLLALMPLQVADAIRVGAIPHWFDQDLFAHLGHGELDVAQAMTYLRRLRFVREDTQGRFRYHDEVRDYLLAWWRQERPHQYEVANRSALAHFRALAEAATSIERPVYEREVLYHLLIVDETVGLRYLSARFEDACGRYQLGLAEGFVTQAAQLKDILTDKGRMWARYFEARLDLVYRRGDAGEATFQELADYALDPILQAVACWNLGEILVNQQHWSRAMGLYRTALDSLQRERALMYGAQVMLALGDAYRDLADSSSGFQAKIGEPVGAAGRFLHDLQHLPFLIYEWLVRRIDFLPNWYFGTNYQDWIIAYLLVEATRWYRQAERQLRDMGDTQGLAEARLSLAELEHQLGRWSRARRRYAMLLETDEIKGSLYRTARVWLGQGRAFLDEGALTKAETALSEAVETFRRFHDDGSIGVTAALLGRVYLTLSRLGEAVSAYVESTQAFGAVEDQLARTPVTERHYITRFPEALLRWFRRLALLGALPLTYVLTFIIGVALTLSLAIIEGELVLSRAGTQTTISDALIIVAVATLPVPLALWLYRLIYSLLGMAFVRFLGRRLLPIERDQPSYLVTDAMSLTRHDVSTGLSHTVAWSDVSLLASVDHYLWLRPIHLISGTILAANSGMMVDAITAGYDHLKQDIARHLGRQRDGAKQQRLDFVILDGRWTLVAIVVSLAFALCMVYTGGGGATVGESMPQAKVPLPLSSYIAWFIPTLLLVFPAIVLWRLVSHQMAIRNILIYQVKTIPAWVLWLGAIVCTVIVALWIVFLFLAGRQ